MTSDLTGLLVSVLERATTRGASAADGFLVEEREFSATVRMGEVEQVAHSHAQRLSLRVFAGRAWRMPWTVVGHSRTRSHAPGAGPSGYSGSTATTSTVR